MKRDLSSVVYIAFMILVFILGSSFESKAQGLKKVFKGATFYTAVSGGNSVADNSVYSVLGGLQTDVFETPFDYSPPDESLPSDEPRSRKPRA